MRTFDIEQTETNRELEFMEYKLNLLIWSNRKLRQQIKELEAENESLRKSKSQKSGK